MNAILPPDLEAFIRAEVANGKYASADDVLAEAVRMLQEHEQVLAALHCDIQTGISALDRGDVTSIRTEADRQALIEGIQRRGRERLQSAQGTP